jgi:DNA-binding transcriptional regulator LsrR (DeoR family)
MPVQAGDRKAVGENPAERSAGRIARNRMRIAWMYYVEGLTQNEIADRLGIGRVTVVRNINEAIRQREVKIWIEGDVAECFQLEAELKARFGLKEAVVVPAPGSRNMITRSIGFATGMYVSGLLAPNMKIGVGWGATLHESLQTLAPPEVENVEVVSLLGGIVQARRFNPGEFAWQFARIVGADCFLVQAPAVVDSPETRNALIERCGLGEVFGKAENLDLVLLSVGPMDANSTAFRFNLMPERERLDLVAAGAVGDMLFNFYDSEGAIIDHPVNRRIMSVAIDKLRNAPARVLASGGPEKIACILGAIKLADINVLVTDEQTAETLLARSA